jgi:hypothetical protein
LVELVGVIATYNMVSRFLVALQVTPEHWSRAWIKTAKAAPRLCGLFLLALRLIAESYKSN